MWHRLTKHQLVDNTTFRYAFSSTPTYPKLLSIIETNTYYTPSKKNFSITCASYTAPTRQPNICVSNPQSFFSTFTQNQPPLSLSLRFQLFVTPHTLLLMTDITSPSIDNFFYNVYYLCRLRRRLTSTTAVVRPHITLSYL